MASPTIKFIKSPSVSVANGSKIVTLTGSVDTYHVYSGTVVFIDNNQPVEAVSGSIIDNSGNSTIVLKDVWPNATVTTGSLVAFNSNEGLPEAIRRARDIGDLTLSLMANFETVLNSTDASVSIDINGVPTNFVPYQYLADKFNNSIVSAESNLAMTKAEFFALAEQNKFASGFEHWGKAYQSAVINEGLWAYPSQPNILNLGARSVDSGKSKSPFARTKINGVIQEIYGTAYIDSVSHTYIKFPTAPDGKKTYDSASGAVVQHASAAIAFAAETATNKVITSRQDFIFIESFHEKISDKDVVYPLGNVQYGGATYDGIALAVNGIAQGYSAFGEWDTTTTGNCAVWSSLTDAQKAAFVQNHENNIYSDNGELIQVRYRVRVVEGLGDNWKHVTPLNGTKNDGANATFLSYAAGGAFVLAQGQGVVPKSSGTLIDGVFNSAAVYGNTYGSWSARSSSWSLLDPNIAHNGLCFAIPVALVQRRNQGAYHPTYNPEGTAGLTDNTGAPTTVKYWQTAEAWKPTSTSDTFAHTTIYTGFTGNIGGDALIRPDSEYYDAIYASDVQDLRMSSEKKAANEISEIYSRKIMDDEVRGAEGTPFTVATKMSAEYISSYITLGYTKPTWWDSALHGLSLLSAGYVTVSDGIKTMYAFSASYLESIGYHLRVSDDPYTNSGVNHGWDDTVPLIITVKIPDRYGSTNPTWTDIIGSIDNIAATFPDGVEAQWIPTISSDTVSFKLSKKSLEATLTQEYTNDSGVTWSVVATVVNEVANTVESHSNFVRLLHYETQASFTESDALGVALHKSTSVMAINNHNDAVLVGSLTGIVPTGADNNEELSITKSVNGVISHTAESMVADVLFATQIESENGVAKFAFNIDDSGVIDSTNAQSFNTQYFISEE